MKIFILMISSLIYSAVVIAQTDYQCVSDCTSKGYQYNLCNNKCSFNEDNSFTLKPLEQQKQTDYQCVTDCTNKGYQYNLCTERCSF